MTRPSASIVRHSARVEPRGADEVAQLLGENLAQEQQMLETLKATAKRISSEGIAVDA